MKLFDVKTENKQEELHWQSGSSVLTSGGLWPAAKQYHLVGDFGKMTFQQIRTKTFGLWSNAYHIQTSRCFKSRLDYRTIELNLVVKNDFTYKLTPFSTFQAREMEFNLSHTPYMENHVKLQGGQDYQTFDLHMGASTLLEIAASYPWQLDSFLNQIIKNDFATLYHLPQPAGPLIVRLFNTIMSRLTENSLDEMTLTTYGRAFIQEAIQQGADLLDHRPITKNMAIARRISRVKTLILINLNRPKAITLKQLGRAVAMNRTDLEKIFKISTGNSIAKYIHDHRMAWAQLLLINNPTLPIGEASRRIGYMNIQGFSGSFAKAIGMSPEKYRKFILAAQPADKIKLFGPTTHL